MSFDCQFKVKEGFCRRINRECEPGAKGCILYGRFAFPLKDEEEEKDDESEKDQDSKL